MKLKLPIGCIAFAYIFVLSLFMGATIIEAGTLHQTETATFYNTKGLELYASGKYEEAIRSYKKAISIKIDYPEAHLNLGDAYMRSTQFKKAIDAYKQALKYQPDLVLAHNNMGTAYYKLGEHKKAIEAYKEALRLSPRASRTYYNLGATHLERGDRKAALEQYKALQVFDPQVANELYVLMYKPTVTVFDVAGNSGVKLNVSVMDAQGVPVNNLKQEDFRILEDVDPQTISLFSKEDVPLVYSLVIDNSGTFGDELDQAVETSVSIIENNRTTDETEVVRFIDSDKIETVQPFTTDKEVLREAVKSLYVEEGQTALLDAVYLSAQRVSQYKPNDGVYRRRAVILVTDGDERSSYYKSDDLLSILHKVDVQIFAIGLTKESKKSSKLNQNPQGRAVNLLKKLASESGGQAFFPKSTAELSSVANQIMNILRSQYIIGYKPTKSGLSESHRKITVSLVDAPSYEKMNVRTRAGYIIPEKQ